MAAKKKTAKKVAKKRVVNSDANISPKGVVKIAVPTPESLDEIGVKKTSYFFGTTKNCPKQNIDKGGHTFHRFSGTPVFDTHGNPDRPLDWGADADLSDAELERVIHAVQRYVIRVFPPDDRGRVRGREICTDDPSYRFNPELDKPLAAFLYMVESDKATRVMRRDCTVPCMMEDAPTADIQPQVGDHRSYKDPGEEDDEETEGVDMSPTPVGGM